MSKAKGFSFQIILPALPGKQRWYLNKRVAPVIEMWIFEGDFPIAKGRGETVADACQACLSAVPV